uniref:L-Fucosyltransferase n=1 Tax=Loa loa TaxID=7209 RepID=A0A1I7VR15_LOALO
MQCKKSSADERVSERRKKVSTRQVKSCSVHGTTTVSVETVTVTRKAIPIDGLSFLTNWSFYDTYVADSNHLNRLSVVQVTRIFPQGGEEVEFDQPWTLPDIKIIENIEDINQSERYIISNFSWSPGLGNLMFQYASLRAIAEVYNAKLIISAKCTLRRGFRLDATIVSTKLNDELIQQFNPTERHFAEDLIHKQFTFLPEIIKRADDYLQEAKYEKLHAEATVVNDLNNHQDQLDIAEDFYGVPPIIL